MPTSNYESISTIMGLIKKLNPQSVLDIGIGFGKYGFLCREYLELWDGRNKYNDWKRTIDGIEIFEPYITTWHKKIYNNIYIGNAIDILPTLNRYDLILLIDIIEHFEYKEGDNLLLNCVNKADSVIIATPKIMNVQNECFNNIYESHKTQWDVEKIKHTKKNNYVAVTKSIICLLTDVEMEKI